MLRLSTGAALLVLVLSRGLELVLCLNVVSGIECTSPKVVLAAMEVVLAPRARLLCVCGSQNIGSIT